MDPEEPLATESLPQTSKQYVNKPCTTKRFYGLAMSPENGGSGAGDADAATSPVQDRDGDRASARTEKRGGDRRPSAGPSERPAKRMKRGKYISRAW